MPKESKKEGPVSKKVKPKCACPACSSANLTVQVTTAAHFTVNDQNEHTEMQIDNPGDWAFEGNSECECGKCAWIGTIDDATQ